MMMRMIIWPRTGPPDQERDAPPLITCLCFEFEIGDDDDEHHRHDFLGAELDHEEQQHITQDREGME